MPESREILVCPSCDSANIRPRMTNGRAGPALGADADRWYCGDCSETFDEPRSRLARHHPSMPEGSVAKLLEDADPEALNRR